MILLVEREESKQKKAQWIVPPAYVGGIFTGDWSAHVVQENAPLVFTIQSGALFLGK